ncbi:MAG: Hsp20/alpha crystallin family protein [Planctomycetes bacterium]|nr:Hsp20/alpha crystallin family protein [Planctomycetota bacterium]
MRRTTLTGPRLGPLFTESLDRLFDLPALAAPPVRPLETRETDVEYQVRCELPGFRPDEVDVQLTADVLTIRARTTPPAGGQTSPEDWPRRPQQVQQAVRFERPIQADQVQAELSHGVLTVRLPKSQAARPRRIEVRSDGGANPPSLEHRPEQPEQQG